MKTARKRRGWSVEELSRIAGVSPRQIWNIENGADAKIGTVLKLTSALGIGVEGDAPPAPAPVRDDSISLPGGLEVIDANPRMVGKPVEALVAAGHGGWDDATDRELVVLPEFLFGPNDFLVQAKGESMADEGISDGDYLVVERRPNGIAGHGDLCIAWLNDGLVIKRWYRRNGRKFLESANAAMGWQPREITPDDVFEIQGIVRHIVKRAKHSRRRADESHSSAMTSVLPKSGSPGIRSPRPSPTEPFEPYGLGRTVDDDLLDPEVSNAVGERSVHGRVDGREERKK